MDGAAVLAADLVHRVDGVADQVEGDLLDLNRIHVQRWQVAVQFQIQLNVVQAGVALGQLEQIFEQVIDLDQLAHALLRFGEALDTLDHRADINLGAAEVNFAVSPLVTTTTVICRDPAGVVAPARLGQTFGQFLDRLAL